MGVQTHPMDQYDMRSGLTYRYYTGTTIATFGEGMPAEDPQPQYLSCSLLDTSILCQITNNSSRPMSALVMLYERNTVPQRTLRAFDRVMVKPLSQDTLQLDITNLSGTVDLWDGWNAFATFNITTPSKQSL